MNCLAIDDEPLALTQIANYISRVPFLTLVKSCQDAYDAMNELATNDIDLIFVDINMPDFNGLDFVKSLLRSPLIIFTTAYSEYAIDGFKVDAVDYLLKPFSFHELLKAADKARQLHEYTTKGKGRMVTAIEEKSLFVKSEYRLLRIDIDKIKYIEGMSEYVRIFVEDEEKPTITLMSLQKMEAKLPPEQFMRVHKSYIVNLRRVNEISRMRIVFDRQTYIPIGDSYKEKFNEFLDKHS